MTIDRELLWKAWPDGYVGMRGVSTVDGWTCIEVQNGHSIFRQHNDPLTVCVRGSSDDVDSVSNAHRRRGDLLPNVDPTDHATWGCLLYDLARASIVRVAGPNKGSIHPEAEADLLHQSRRWYRDSTNIREMDAWWMLESADFDVVANAGKRMVKGCLNFYFDEKFENEPALALVHARIQLNERIR